VGTTTSRFMLFSDHSLNPNTDVRLSSDDGLIVAVQEVTIT